MVDGRTGHHGAHALHRAKAVELYLETGTVATQLPYSADTDVRVQTTRPKSAAALENVQVV